MNYIKAILGHLEQSNGIITTEYCRKENIPTIYLTRLVREGALTRVDRGIYISKNGDYDEHYFFQHRFKKAVFSYETALCLQGLTDKVSRIMEVTVPYSYKFNQVPNNLEVYYVKKEIAEMGITITKTNFGNEVKAYNIERVICDLIQNKSDIDPEIYVKTIRNYAASKASDINKLFIYAERMGITEKVRNTMEIIYE